MPSTNCTIQSFVKKNNSVASSGYVNRLKLHDSQVYYVGTSFSQMKIRSDVKFNKIFIHYFIIWVVSLSVYIHCFRVPMKWTRLQRYTTSWALRTQVFLTSSKSKFDVTGEIIGLRWIKTDRHAYHALTTSAVLLG